MTRGRIFWGVFLIAAGVLFLLERLNVFFLSWDNVWRFWPLLLVIWGAALLVRDRRVAIGIAGLAGLSGAIFLYAFVSQAHWGGWDEDVVVQELSQEYSAPIHRAKLNFDSGAGKFRLEGTTNNLVSAEARTSLGGYALYTTGSGDSTNVSLHFQGEDVRWRRGGITNRVELRLHPEPVWDLSFDVGASGLDLDLAPFTVEKVTVNAGAAEVRIKMGDRAQEAHVIISSGVSSIRIDVPSTVGCEIKAETPLSRKSFHDFAKSDDGAYRTANFNSAAKKIVIDIDAGVSDVRVRKY